MAGWAEGDIERGGVKLHYYRTGHGDKPPLVLAHGFTDNGLCWTRFARALEARYDVVMVDARNHGKSGTGEASLPTLAGDMAAVIRELELGQSAVLGHSVGASTAAALAGQFPELVSKLVLEDPPWMANPAQSARSPARIAGFRDHVESMAGLSQAEIIQQGKKQHPRWHDEEFGAWAESNSQVSAEAMALLELGDWSTLIAPIVCPTLLVFAAGSSDGIVTFETADKVAATNSHIRAHHIPDAGHNLRREQFAPFVEAVTGFLAYGVFDSATA